MLNEATRTMTSQEKKLQKQLTRLMQDPVGKAFTTAMTDECFRSNQYKRVADQLIYLLNQLGIPQYFDWVKRPDCILSKRFGPLSGNTSSLLQ